MPAIPVLGEPRQEDSLKSKASLDYLVSSKPAWSTEWDSVLNKTEGKLKETHRKLKVKITISIKYF